MKKTYSIEIKHSGSDNWCLCNTWSGMLKSKAEGVLMALDAFYGTNSAYRMVCERDRSVVHTIYPKKAPSVPENLSDPYKSILYNNANRLWVQLNSVIPHVYAVYYHKDIESFVILVNKGISPDNHVYLSTVTNKITVTIGLDTDGNPIKEIFPGILKIVNIKLGELE